MSVVQVHSEAPDLLAGVAQLAEQLICNQQVAGSSPITSSKLSLKTESSIPYLLLRGWVPEWPKGADCKSVVVDFDGSNPSPSTNFTLAGMAELADAHGSGPCEVTLMQVQVLFPAPIRKSSNNNRRLLYFLLFSDKNSA